MGVLAWRGYGLIGLLISGLGYLIARLISDGTPSATCLDIIFSILAVPTWFIGKHLNKDAKIIGYSAHTLMFIPLQYAGIVIAIYAIWYNYHSAIKGWG